MSRKQNKPRARIRERRWRQRQGGDGGRSRRVAGLSDPFAPSAICQRDVISLRPTMKVISQSEGISREPRLLQRPGKLGPVTLFMLEVRQTASSRRQLKWLMIPFPPPSNLNTYNPCGPADMFLSTLTICKSPRKKGEGGAIKSRFCRFVFVSRSHIAGTASKTFLFKFSRN